MSDEPKRINTWVGDIDAGESVSVKEFKGTVDIHLCDIPTACGLDISESAREQIQALTVQIGKTVMLFMLEAGLDPRNTHFAVSISLDSGDHPNGEPAKEYVN